MRIIDVIDDLLCSIVILLALPFIATTYGLWVAREMLGMYIAHSVGKFREAMRS